MSYLVTAELVASCISKKCLKRLSLLFHQRESLTADRKWLSPAVADQGGYSAILSVGEKAHRGGTVGSFVSLPARCCARGGHQFPSARKFVACVPYYIS